MSSDGLREKIIPYHFSLLLRVVLLLVHPLGLMISQDEASAIVTNLRMAPADLMRSSGRCTMVPRQLGSFGVGLLLEV